MKTNFTFLVVALLFSLMSAQAQDCSDLFISEYVEGWSNNKSIEIYNPTPNAIDASEYGLVRFSNGSATPGYITYLEGVSIEPYDVLVVTLDQLNPDGTGQDAPIWDDLQLQTDVYLNPDYEVIVDGQALVTGMYFNGNDAVALMKDNGNTLVDLFGKIADGLNPDGWGSYNNTIGETVYISANHTLVRKPEVTQGVTLSPVVFEILNEYDSLPANTFDQLGFHMCSCGDNSIQEQKKLKLNISPNPVSNGMFTVYGGAKISSFEIIDLTGRVVLREEAVNQDYLKIDSTVLSNGTYVFKAKIEDNIVSQMFIK